ncbi:hypothetical protein D3C85_1547720 [compost metagenome]
MNRLRAEQVVFAVFAPLVFTAGIKLLLPALLFCEGTVMMEERFRCNDIQTNAADAGRRPSEVLVYE